MISKTLAVAVTCGLIWAPLVASGDPVPKAPVLCLEGSPCQQPATTSPSVPAPPPAGSVAIKFEPGWYALAPFKLLPANGSYGETLSQVLTFLKTEICGNRNIKGVKFNAAPIFFEGETANDFDGDQYGGGGFPWMDAMLSALNSCNKFLMIINKQAQYGGTGGPDGWASYMPAYMIQAANGGTDLDDPNAVYGATFKTGVGITMNLWKQSVRDRAIAVGQAYCARYDGNPAFYAFGMYYNDSIGVDRGTYPQQQFYTYHRDVANALRVACPHTNIIELTDFSQPFPAGGSTMLANIRANNLAFGNNDTIPNQSTWSQRVFVGEVGSPSVIDYRGAIRFFAEIESPEMCGKEGTWTPAQLVERFSTGATYGGIFYPPFWPQHAIINMARCPNESVNGWTAWKNYLQSTGGKVWNGHDSTLRTPADVKANWCESSMVCP